MDTKNLVSEKELEEICNQWIEEKIWGKVRTRYPDDSKKASEYFKELMSDTSELAELQSEFYNERREI